MPMDLVNSTILSSSQTRQLFKYPIFIILFIILYNLCLIFYSLSCTPSLTCTMYYCIPSRTDKQSILRIKVFLYPSSSSAIFFSCYFVGLSILFVCFFHYRLDITKFSEIHSQSQKLAIYKFAKQTTNRDSLRC